MIPGMMDKFITIEQETTADNAVGTSAETYTTLRTDFASIKNTFGNTDFEEGAHAFTRIEFSLRWNSDMTGANRYKRRILYDGQYYKIVHSEDIGRKDGIRLKCVLWDE